MWTFSSREIPRASRALVFQRAENDIYHSFYDNGEVSVAVSQGYVASALCQMSNRL